MKLYATLVALVAVIMFNPVSALADTWGEPINTPDRFIVLPSFDNRAVRDTETGLVWEQTPSDVGKWAGAQIHCNQTTVGNRKGWRLPTIQELASLIDPTVPSPGPTLPANHPFGLFLGYSVWSATTGAGDTSNAWLVSFIDGSVQASTKSYYQIVWCVRGGQGVDLQ